MGDLSSVITSTAWAEWFQRLSDYYENVPKFIDPKSPFFGQSAPANPSEGLLAFADGTNWDPIGTGVAGVYIYEGAAWKFTGAILPASTVTSETAFGVLAAVGTSRLYARADHTHGTPTDPIPAHVAASDPHIQYQREVEKGAASGYASLNASTLVVENPANATATPTASKIPIADGAGDLDAGWIPVQLGAHTFGGATHKSEFEADGTVKFNGDATVWNDLQFQISSGRIGVANFPDWDTFTTNTSEYNFDVDDYIDLGANEFPHGWKEGSDATVHLHLAISTAQSAGADRFAKFTVYIGYADLGEVWAEIGPFTAEYTIPNGTAALTHYKLAMGTLSLPNNVFGSHLKARIKRIAATGGTEYPAHVFISQLGVHVEQDTIGSRTSSAK